jgi:hypothetical protein
VNYFLTGHRLSILRMIFSAVAIESAIQASIAGDDLPSSCANHKAAKMDAAINKTRFLPSSTMVYYPLRFIFALL